MLAEKLRKDLLTQRGVTIFQTTNGLPWCVSSGGLIVGT